MESYKSMWYNEVHKFIRITACQKILVRQEDLTNFSKLICYNADKIYMLTMGGYESYVLKWALDICGANSATDPIYRYL